MGTKIGWKMIAGVFLVTLSSLMLEILMTRIFSVTLWYHFAFMAISIAMFGTTVGAVIVYLSPKHFTAARARTQMAQHALLACFWALLSFLIHVNVHFQPEVSWSGLASVALTFGAMAMPFLFSGICVTLALTRFPSHVSRVYAADLAGAAAGAFLLSLLLGPLDGPTTVVAVSLAAALGAFFFSLEAGAGRLARLALAACLLLAGLAAANAAIPQPKEKWLAVRRVKGALEDDLLLEKWSSYARVAVRRLPPGRPIGWGLSDTVAVDGTLRQLYMDIDATAGSVLTEFTGDTGRLEFLKADITNIAHFIRPRANVLIVGTGGGRDVLSALVFSQKKITGVEINRDILDAVNRDFGAFTGHLDRRPGVSFVNDEARSYLTRSTERFDLIQLSLIDTWSATAAGAFVLSENALYTVEAWEVFLERLAANGLLSVSRWFTHNPAEMYRLTHLAVEALRRWGARDPAAHLVVVRQMLPQYNRELGVGTLLMNRAPFTASEVAALSRDCRRLGFEMVLAPGAAAAPGFRELTSRQGSTAFVDGYPLNIAAPSDDSPFFFNMLRLKDAFRVGLWFGSDQMPFNSRAVLILGVLLAVVLLLVALCVAVPLALTWRRTSFAGTLPFFLYFAGIGAGFMLVEVAQMQRLSVFLGHPNYGLTVVLFSLLLACSLGSRWSGTIGRNGSLRPILWTAAALPLCLLLFGAGTPPLMALFRGALTPLRVAVAVFLLFVPGVLMGTAFPLGMRLLGGRQETLAPWLWGVNGSLSVLASVLAVAISLNWGISTSYWSGLACYAAAFAALWIMARRPGVR